MQKKRAQCPSLKLYYPFGNNCKKQTKKRHQTKQKNAPKRNKKSASLRHSVLQNYAKTNAFNHNNPQHPTRRSPAKQRKQISSFATKKQRALRQKNRAMFLYQNATIKCTKKTQKIVLNFPPLLSVPAPNTNAFHTYPYAKTTTTNQHVFGQFIVAQTRKNLRQNGPPQNSAPQRKHLAT